MRIVFDDIKESLAPNFKGGEKSFASRAYSDGKNKMMKGRLVPGASIGLHRHEGNCEMIYVLEGSAKCFMTAVRKDCRQEISITVLRVMSIALSMTATATLCLLQLCQLSRFLQLCICEIVGQNGFVV